MHQALMKGRASDGRWHLRKGGQLFWASGEMTPLYGNDNAHLGFVKILRDRTSEYLANLAITESQERCSPRHERTNAVSWLQPPS